MNTSVKLSAKLNLALALIVAMGAAPAALAADKELKGTVMIDGSSTVYPISEAMAEEFGKEAPGVRVTVGMSGTGGGFKKFAAGEIDIAGASRPIKDSEAEACKKAGIKTIEIPVAYDGLAVVINPKNTWVDHLSVEELNKIWKPGSTVKTWKDVRATWPDKPIKPYGPGTDSGTFDYFTEVINGKAQASRSDYTKSEDDNVLVQGVMGDEGAMGYFGYAYYAENEGKLKVVPIVGKSGKPVAPTPETVKSGKYAPLSRPLFIYVNLAKARQKPEVSAFVRFTLENASSLVKDVGYVPMQDKEYKATLSRFQSETAKKVGQR